MVYDDEPIFGVFESVPIKVDLLLPRDAFPLFPFLTHTMPPPRLLQWRTQTFLLVR